MIERSRSENWNLWLFFLIAFAFSWILWIPKALVSQGLLLPSSLAGFLFSPFNPAAFGTLVAAFALTYLNERKKGVVDLLRRGVYYRIGKRWYVPIFLLFPAITSGALLLSILAGGVVPPLPVLSNPLLIVIGFVYIFFLGGPLEEEFGWRGYALDRLQARHNALVSSVILGLIWGAWHLPLFFVPGETIYYKKPIWGTIFALVFYAILFTWIYNNTGRSILATMLFHTMGNLSHFVFPTLETDLGSLYYLILLPVVVIPILIVWGSKRLVRETKSNAKYVKACI